MKEKNDVDLLVKRELLTQADKTAIEYKAKQRIWLLILRRIKNINKGGKEK